MSNILITIETPDGPLDLAVPAHLGGAELLAILASTIGASALDGWTLATSEGLAIEGPMTLEDAGVLDGFRIHLTPVGVKHPVRRGMPSPVVTVDVGEWAGRVLPDQPETVERVWAVIRAFVGLDRPKGARGSMQRAAAAWRWSEHVRRLEWLMSRPQMTRTVTIGIVGHRSDEIAEQIGTAFGSARPERVVLVDADHQHHRISRSLGADQPTFESIESGMRRRDITSVERDAMFARTASGMLTVPIDPSAPLPDGQTFRRLLDSLDSYAGIVVIDCGPVDSANALAIEICDQVVVAPLGDVPRVGKQTVVADWTGHLGRLPAETLAVHRITDDVTTMIELAVVVVSGWSFLEISTPMPLGV